MGIRSPRWLGAVCTLGAGLAASVMAAQSPNPTYLAEMPTPARIVAEIKGKSPEDTIERQMGAFQALLKMVDDMAWTTERRYLPANATPDENSVKLAYGNAYADLWHKATNKEDHLYDHDRDLLNELLGKFFPADFLDLYFKGNPNGRKIFDAARQGKNIVVTGMAPGATGLKPAAEAAAAKASAAAQDDPEKLCAAKGLDQFTCMVQGMMGMVFKAVDAVQGPAKPGLRISGAYQAGNFNMILDHGGIGWVHCGDVFLQSSYSIARDSNQLLLRLTNGDAPFTLGVGTDGTTLTGPATVTIHGYAPGGSRTTSTPGTSQQVTTTRQQELTPLEAGQYQDAKQNGQTYTINETSTSTEYTPGTTSTTPVYNPKSAVCKIGTLPVLPARPVEAPKKPVGLTDYFAGMIPPSPFIPNGLKLAGTYYGQGGASIEFLADKAIVGCHVTQAEHPYALTSKAGGLVINLSGAGAPATLSIGADLTLHGDGASLQIEGHKKTGENAIGDPVYAASSDTCSYGSLATRATKQ
jgi:hypothetical protein